MKAFCVLSMAVVQACGATEFAKTEASERLSPDARNHCSYSQNLDLAEQGRKSEPSWEKAEILAIEQGVRNLPAEASKAFEEFGGEKYKEVLEAMAVTLADALEKSFTGEESETPMEVARVRDWDLPWKILLTNARKFWGSFFPFVAVSGDAASLEVSSTTPPLSARERAAKCLLHLHSIFHRALIPSNALPWNVDPFDRNFRILGTKVLALAARSAELLAAGGTAYYVHRPGKDPVSVNQLAVDLRNDLKKIAFHDLRTYYNCNTRKTERQQATTILPAGDEGSSKTTFNDQGHDTEEGHHQPQQGQIAWTPLPEFDPAFFHFEDEVKQWNKRNVTKCKPTDSGHKVVRSTSKDNKEETGSPEEKPGLPKATPRCHIIELLKDDNTTRLPQQPRVVAAFARFIIRNKLAPQPALRVTCGEKRLVIPSSQMPADNSVPKNTGPRTPAGSQTAAGHSISQMSAGWPAGSQKPAVNSISQMSAGWPAGSQKPAVNSISQMSAGWPAGSQKPAVNSISQMSAGWPAGSQKPAVNLVSQMPAGWPACSQRATVDPVPKKTGPRTATGSQKPAVNSVSQTTPGKPVSQTPADSQWATGPRTLAVKSVLKDPARGTLTKYPPPGVGAH